jgi:hypothetical protein
MTTAREAGDRYYDAAREQCLIVRDTCWYAVSLLFDESSHRRSLGNHLLGSVKAEDGTHTPATLLAILHRIPGQVTPDVRTHMQHAVKERLVDAALTEWRDGNVNHPLGAYCSLILGGEMSGQQWATDLGLRRLSLFRERIGEHRSRYRRQAEMSEYNSPTYTALTLWFLALIAEHSTTEKAQRLALFLEERLWVDVAMHFHAPSRQFAGPHSRSYQDDSIGGFSALHCTMFAAFDEPLFLFPELCYRFNHPSTLVQNALVAILPFHVPPLARTIAEKKPFPYSFRKTTYGESYHENHRRRPTTEGRLSPGLPGEANHGVAPGTPDNPPFAFDEDVYPGGWSDLTTYMTDEYALGSASMPYVNAGHSDSVMLRIRRNLTIQGMEDFRSAYTRGVYNGARVGEKNFCHVAQTPIDESYLYEEGRSAAYQHENKLIVCYSPKRAGHCGVHSFRLDLIFSYFSPFDLLVIDGRPVSGFPVRCSASSRICFRDFHTFGAIVPLQPSPSPSELPVLIWRCGEFLVFSFYNYEGDEHDFPRHEINGWQTGFALELASAGETTWEQFLLHAQSAGIAGTVSEGMVRTIRFASGTDSMEFAYDPFKEVILSRRWNGESDCVNFFAVSAGGNTTGIFCPPTLFGNEAMS